MKPVPQLLSHETPAELEARDMLADLDNRITEWSGAAAAAIAASLAVQAHGGLDRDELREFIADDMHAATWSARWAITQILEGTENDPH